MTVIRAGRCAPAPAAHHDGEPQHVRLVLADDNRIFRTGLAALLSTEPGVDVVRVVENGLEAVAAVAESNPDVVLMDVHMPVMGGIEATRWIAKRHPRTAVVLLTGLSTEDWVHDPVALGASACVSKSVRVEELVAVARSAVVEAVPQGRSRRWLHDGRLEHLTERELKILALVARGHPSSEIAQQLRLQSTTVRNYLNVIYDKLGVRGRSSAVLYAARAGLLDVSVFEQSNDQAAR